MDLGLSTLVHVPSGDVHPGIAKAIKFTCLPGACVEG